MFEKEAEKYAKQNNPAEYGVRATHFTVLNSFKDGAEFGYNKANEWHDLEKNPNDLPSKGRLVICYLKEDVFDVGIFKKEIELQCGKERIRKWAYFELPEELK